MVKHRVPRELCAKLADQLFCDMRVVQPRETGRKTDGGFVPQGPGSRVERQRIALGRENVGTPAGQGYI